MNPTKDTPTPRTDGIYHFHEDWSNEEMAADAIIALRDFARDLERENKKLHEYAKYVHDHARAGLDSGGNIYLQLNLINSATIEILK
jgi:hypothetical protein